MSLLYLSSPSGSGMQPKLLLVFVIRRHICNELTIDQIYI